MGEFLLLLFCSLAHASGRLFVPARVIRAVNPTPESCLFVLNNDGGHYLEYYTQSPDMHVACIQEKGVPFRGVESPNQDVIVDAYKQAKYARPNPADCELIKNPFECNLQYQYLPFSQNFWDWLFLNKFPARESICLKRADLGLLIELPSSIREFYYNNHNNSAYYLDNEGLLKCVDLSLAAPEYRNLFEPISRIKYLCGSKIIYNGKWTFSVLDPLKCIVAWKSFFIFLKNYFYHAHGNTRLKNSLREVFFNNAGALLRYLVPLYYLAFLFLMSRPNVGFGIIFAKSIFLLHVILRFLYPRLKFANRV